MKLTEDQLSKLKGILWNPKFTHSERVQKIKEVKDETN